MTNHYASIVTDTSISVFVNGKAYSISHDHPNFKEVSDALKREDYTSIIKLMDIRTSVLKFLSLDKSFTLVGDRVTFEGYSFSDVITNKVLSMMRNGFNAEPLFNFLRKVRKNPSATAQDELLLFCEANKFMIHTDGDILAYKAVRPDYKDIYSGTISNHVGAVITMDRSSVDDNRDRTCSFGLHFAAYGYALGFGGRNGHLMVMKINPADVVSIPSDYNNQKGRCARYEVISEVTDYVQLQEKEVYSNRDLGLDDEEYDDDHYPDDDCNCPECVSILDDDYEQGYADAMYESDNGNDPNSRLSEYSDSYRSGYNDGWYDSTGTLPSDN
jgi:hypothetical protein